MINTNTNTNTMKIQGQSEKQVNYAADLLDTMTEKVTDMESRGREHRVIYRRPLIDTIKRMNPTASQIIEVLQNWNVYKRDVERGSDTWESLINRIK